MKSFKDRIMDFFGYHYVLNVNTGEVHDLRNIKSNCGYNKMSYKNKIYLSKTELKDYMLLSFENKTINGCRYCYSEDNTD